MTVSIITPLHNSYHLLDRCYQSLLKQQNCKIEWIIVDDCSTDDSFMQAKGLSGSENLTIRVFQNQVNGGPGVSRNYGVSQATGEYITFVDSDDYLADDFCIKMNPFLEKGYDCIIFDYQSVDEEGKLISTGSSMGINGLQQGELDPRFALVYVQGTTWGKIYKRELVQKNQVQFGEFFRAEDTPFTKHAVACSEKVFYNKGVLYNYVQRSTSLMHSDELLDENNSKRAFELLSERLNGKGFEEELSSICMREVINNAIFIRVAKKEKSKSIRKYIRENYKKEFIKNKYFSRYPMHVKIVSWLAYYKCIFGLRIILKYKARIKRRKRGE